MLSSSTPGGIAEKSSPAAFGYHKHISLREASEEVSVTKKGTRIHHAKRGLGTVVETLNDGRSKCAPRRRRDAAAWRDPSTLPPAAATLLHGATHRPSRRGGSLSREILACSCTPARQTLACSACCHKPARSCHTFIHMYTWRAAAAFAARACPTSMHMACCCCRVSSQGRLRQRRDAQVPGVVTAQDRGKVRRGTRCRARPPTTPAPARPPRPRALSTNDLKPS